ncbi:MAG: hypothetical protein ACK2UO_03190 [Caldilineaceae bacterium]
MRQLGLFRWAVLIHAVNSVFLVVASFPILLNGPDSQSSAIGIPQMVIVAAALLGVAGLVSAYGAWQGQRWGIALTIVLEAVNGLLALPGLVFAPTESARISAIAGVVIALFVIFGLMQGARSVRSATGG